MYSCVFYIVFSLILDMAVTCVEADLCYGRDHVCGLGHLSRASESPCELTPPGHIEGGRDLPETSQICIGK